MTSVFHLYELHVQIAKAGSQEAADVAFRTLRNIALAVEDDDVLEASRLKMERRKLGFSYADALGYAMARRRSMPFVTGDQAFRGLDGVEFVPAGRR